MGSLPASEFRKRIRPYLRAMTVIILAVLALFVGLRIYNWNSSTAEARSLTLVNPWNPMSETGYRVQLTEIEDGFLADRDCADALKQMLADCREAGNDVVILGAYRSVDDQLELYDEEVRTLQETVGNPEEAERTVSQLVAKPGRSEHELGLAFDLVDAEYPLLDERQSSTKTGFWLGENAWRYGFIQRYPAGAENITGFSWHPWHYRYVGEDAARNIWSLGITLEEYLSMFYSDEASVMVDAG